MTRKLQHILAVTRILFGWVFFWAGLSKIIDPSWSAAGYLSNASTFPEFFAWLAGPANIEWVSFLNEWGLLIIGVSLMLGLCVRWAAFFGFLLMILYWLPALDFPYVGHGFIIDDHIMYAMLFIILGASHAGRYFGLDKLWSKKH